MNGMIYMCYGITESWVIADMTGNKKVTGIIKSEIFFFAAAILAVCIKFYFLEYEVSGTVARMATSTVATFGFVLSTFTLLALLPKRSRKYAVIVWDFLLTALVITDLLFIRYYSDLFAFVNLGLSTQVGAVSDSVFALFHVTDLFYFADFVLLIWLILPENRYGTQFAKYSLRRAVALLIVIALGAFAVYFRFASYNVPGVLKAMWDKPAICNNIGAVCYHLADARNTVRDILLKERISAEEKEKIVSWLETHNKSSNEEINYGLLKGANLIIIQVESLQNFVVNRRINGEEITPNLNRFIKKSYYFDHIYNQTAAGNSADAEFLANTGFYPAQSGVAYIRFSNKSFEAMPKLLAEAGYETLALHGDRPGFWNRQAIYPKLGFNKFISKNELDASEIIGIGISDESFLKQSASILKETKQPFYAFLITLTSHYPYDWPEMLSAAKLNTGQYKDTLLGNYLVSMKYFDTQFGKFIKTLERDGLLENSLIVVYGDHTAIPRWDMANLQKLLKKDLKSSTNWCREQTVPLIIYTPKGKLRGRSYRTGGLIDLSKTLTVLLGVDMKYTLGCNLFDGSRQQPVIFKNESYIVGRNFVEPSIKEAHNLDTGKKLNFADFKKSTEQAAKIHNMSNTILEQNLLKK